MNIKIYTFPFWGHTEQAAIIANRLSSEGMNVSVDMAPEYYGWIDDGIKKTECRYLVQKQDCEKNEVSANSLFGFAESILQCTMSYLEEELEGTDLVIFDSFAYWGNVLAHSKGIPSVSLMTLQPFTEADFKADSELMLKQYADLFASKREFERMLHIYEVTANSRFDIGMKFRFADLFCSKGDKNIVLFPKRFCYYADSLDESYTWGRVISERFDPASVKDEKLAYVSFGSILEDKELLMECIDVLLERGYNVTAKTSRHIDELTEHYRDYKERLTLYKTASQKEILKKAGLFITHGGANSVLEAMISRTPMVVIPLANDEIINGRMVVRNDYGVMHEGGKDISRWELSKLVEAVEKDDNIRKHLSDDQKENSECALNRICEEVLSGK